MSDIVTKEVFITLHYIKMLHVTFLTLLRALEVNIDLRHANHIRYYYYFFHAQLGLDVFSRYEAPPQIPEQ